MWSRWRTEVLYDTFDWRQALTTIEEAAAAVAQRDPEIAAQLREVDRLAADRGRLASAARRLRGRR